MSEYRIISPKNPLPDGTPQYEYLTDEEYSIACSAIQSDEELMSEIRRQAEKVIRERGKDEPSSDEVPIAGSLPRIAELIRSVTHRDSSISLAFEFVAEFLQHKSLI